MHLATGEHLLMSPGELYLQDNMAHRRVWLPGRKMLVLSAGYLQAKTEAHNSLPINLVVGDMEVTGLS